MDDRPTRITLAAAILASTTLIGLSGGVARADDDGSGATRGDAGSSQTSRAERVSAKPPMRVREDRDAEDADRADRPDDAAASSSAETETETSERSDRAQTATRPEPASDAEPVETDVEPAKTEATAVRAVSPAPVTTPDTDTAPAETDTVLAPNLGRQLAGGLSDVGTIVVSVVYATATAVATAFGDSFFGVPHLLATMVANTAAAVGRTLVGGRLHEPTADQNSLGYGLLDMTGFFDATRPPPGANDPSRTVTPEHPLPVILLNSTVLTQSVNWYAGAPALAGAGYKVYTFNYGNVTSNPRFPLQSIADIRTSAAELAAEIDRVLAETGAPQVILIGHSQGGGALPSYYINTMGGAAKVSQLVGIGPGHHGTDFMGLVGLVLKLPILRQLYIGISEAVTPAIYQQSVGSPFLDEVYGDGDTRPGVLYTTISTAYDEVATPYTNQALVGPNVTNILLQQRFPGLLLGHLNMVTSPHTWTVVLEALASNPAANPAVTGLRVA